MPSRHIWPLYALLLSALAWVFFADVLTLGLDTHDAETFRDHERIAGDFAYFFSPAKEQASGRPAAEIVKFLYFMALGNDPATFHLLSLALHVLCSFLLARVVLQCGATLELSLLGGLLFLCNIAHFQVVHYISALYYALALGIGALLAYRRYLITAKLAHLDTYYILLFTAVLRTTVHGSIFANTPVPTKHRTKVLRITLCHPPFLTYPPPPAIGHCTPCYWAP